MPGALHAELADDGRTMVLLPVGDDFSRAQITTRLAKVTPAGHVDLRTGAVTMACTWPAVVQLSASFAPSPDLAFVPHQKLAAWIRAEHARRLADPPELEKSWPDGLEPRPYQVEAARQIAAAGRYLLLDDPGVGKTAMTILGIEQRRRLGHAIFPLVILVPSWDVADSWDSEIRRWMPSWPDPVMYGGSGRVAGAVSVTTYATARRDAADASGPLVKLKPASVVLDESHLIRTGQAKQTLAAQRIAKHAGTVIGLSGTLIVRDTGDAFPVLKALDEASWPSKERFRDRFCLTRKDDYAEHITGLKPETEPEFRTCLAGQIIRRSRRDVLKDLPEVIYSVRRPEIPAEWIAAYRQMEQDMLAELPDGGELNAMDTLTQLTRLSQLASSAADVEWEEIIDTETGELVKKQKVTLRAPSWKAESLLEILAERTEPAAVFTDSRQLAVICARYLSEAGLRFGLVIGQGPVDGAEPVTQRSRREAIEAFQAGRRDAIVCTAGAGGTGITLTRAATVVMLQRSWQLDLAVQPEGRADRLGNKNGTLEIIDIVAKGTVDQRRRSVLRGKAGMAAEFARDPRIVKELLGGNQ